MRAARTHWLAAAVLLWLAVGMAYYYAFHRPFTPALALRAVLAVRDLACTALLFAAGGALGTRLLRQAPVHALTRLALRAAAGLGLLSLGYLLIGTWAGTHAWLAWGVLLAVLFVLRAELAQWWQDASRISVLWRFSGRLGRTLGWLNASLLAASLLLALAPPLVFDALVYHLSLPRLYLAQGQIGYVPEITHWGFPQLLHVLVTWAGALGVGHGALVAWGMGLLAALGLLGFFAQAAGPCAAWVGLASLLSGASLVTALSSGYVDWPGLLMGLGVLAFLELWLRQGELRWALWAGIFCGLAFGSKYTAGLYAPLGVLVLLAGGKPAGRAVLAYLLAALAWALPWLLRNTLYTGNPFYPLLLPGGEMDTIRLSYYQGFAPQGNWQDALLLPLRATWLGIEGGRIGDAPGYETSLGPLLLLFGVLAWLPTPEYEDRPSFKRVATLVGVGGLLLWAVAGRLTGHLIRSHLYFSLFPAFAMLAAHGFAGIQPLRLGAVRVGRVAAVVACLALGLSALQAGLGLVQRGVGALWSGAWDEQAYAEHNLGLYALVMEHVPQNGRTLMLWETRGLACLPACDPDEVIDRWPHDLARYGSPQAVTQQWRQAGFDYVLYYRLGAQFVHSDPAHFHSFDLAALEEALAQLRVVQDFNGDYVLYALTP